MNGSHVWSYSSLDCFAQCPRKFYHRYVLREKEPETDALRHGNAVHAALEQRIKGTPLPEALQRYDPMAQSIINAWHKGMKVYAELKMGLTRNFEPCGFFDKNVWGRGAADVILIAGDKAVIFDWKTGKKREKEDQLRLLAMFVFKHFPTVAQVAGMNLWLEPNEIGSRYTYLRQQEPALWQYLIPQIQSVERALTENSWPEKPSGLCGWCSVKACQFNKS